jgi:hypothetical protein
LERIFEPITCERKVSPVLKNMTVEQASHIFNKAGIAIEVYEGRRVKFVEGRKEESDYGFKANIPLWMPTL